MINQKTWRPLPLFVILFMLAVGGSERKGYAFEEQPFGRLQTTLENVAKNPGIPGVLLNVNGPKLGNWSGAAGLGNIDTQVAMKSSNQFRAGSIMKVFISVVTLQLVEENRFSLDDPISALLPQSVTSRFANSDQITVRMLLNHTGGIAEWVTDVRNAEIAANPRKIWTDADQLNIAAERGPTFAPGQGWAYSNTHFVLLGKIIQQTTGHAWRNEIRKRIIDKLELGNTRLPAPGDTSIPPSHARGYHLTNGKFVDLTEVDPSMAGPAGGHALVTTAEDLIRFLNAVLAGEFFQNEKTLNQMLAFIDAPDEHGVPYYYGLAMKKYVLPGDIEMIGHAGSTAGFASVVYHLPAQNFTVSAMINTQDLESVYLKVLIPVLEVLKDATVP